MLARKIVNNSHTTKENSFKKLYYIELQEKELSLFGRTVEWKMKLARLGTLFRIFAILAMIVTTLVTVLAFLDLRNIMSNPTGIVQPPESMGLEGNMTPTVITEEGEVTGWQLNLGSIQFTNPGEYLSLHDLYLKVEILNKSSGEAFILLETEENVNIEPGTSKNISLPLTITRTALLTATDFLFKIFRKELYEQVNGSFPSINLDETIWNETVFTRGAVFDIDLFEQLILNATFLKESTEDVKWESLIDFSEFNDTLVTSYSELSPSDLSLIEIKEENLFNRLSNFGRYMEHLIEQLTVRAEITVGVGFKGLPLIRFTIKPEGDAIIDMFGEG
ncbi:MAG: hypothetical protein GWO20_00060 [Candidatus Korarchaeota archaeon]|nr:hypothetical protein [Candidatus Korarchaeota archaeon]NIU81887.1 hypothetical protein [Candidatus Thorarchaeota archaeon]NIW12340.1 hypothetical protein [Candidatus Thorarchaeota archaeon]NIW50617.1 hypothetical protein [Candidatus Korarchaeota archaeon]